MIPAMDRNFISAGSPTQAADQVPVDSPVHQGAWCRVPPGVGTFQIERQTFTLK